MPIIVNLDVMLARRKIRSRELAARIELTEANVSLLKSGKVRGIRFDTLERICAVLDCQPGDILEYVPENADNALEPRGAGRKSA
ncbi:MULTISPECIES: helix-turn-helix domain-containing protein [Bradyrhizobium]|jgi:putative transcriptional regulator|uniref:helix-turn-helix domain-containing protein n=1 Tax=Bradyrhizobium TaxID=374 RepID=UPI000231C9D7|nr:helix-turn-helix transcriptional regulator [Bradyrhizobium japonicum]MBR0759021.1 helix-turn-helix transcriptional regulator [Bradyrhizobium japonicum]MCS3541074.1 putative transcriptional regulator [Bradyrhizobium japonicum]MCS3991743.1 putative transcriptional regulator [Bradyrhizobium japonicum]MCS4013448.1 putative transcriptional regulator [Bradyrhizobium japonicum]MCS4209455.1 putative transcriptional regulator [Bradyrhizobium japonicum]